MTRQLEFEKAALLEKKRREVDERRRKQEELDHILLENRRKVASPAPRCTVPRQTARAPPPCGVDKPGVHRHTQSP